MYFVNVNVQNVFFSFCRAFGSARPVDWLFASRETYWRLRAAYLCVPLSVSQEAGREGLGQVDCAWSTDVLAAPSIPSKDTCFCQDNQPKDTLPTFMLLMKLPISCMYLHKIQCLHSRAMNLSPKEYTLLLCDIARKIVLTWQRTFIPEFFDAKCHPGMIIRNPLSICSWSLLCAA